MPTIVYKDRDDVTSEFEVDADASVMRTAIVNGVDGIVGECGGQAMCATCHVFVEEVSGGLPEVSEDEDEMLECTAQSREDNSRLGCQLRAESFDRIVVRLPESQVCQY